jgi:DNA (cytosine-5)-methyltransferase 1
LVETIKSKDTVYQWRRIYVRENQSNVCPTLTANMGTGGHNVPLIKVDDGIRKLTPRECFNLQGFPESFKLPETTADSHLYKQAGNSVTVPVIVKLASAIGEAISNCHFTVR